MFNKLQTHNLNLHHQDQLKKTNQIGKKECAKDKELSITTHLNNKINSKDPVCLIKDNK
jgi:hypothetical protein